MLIFLATLKWTHILSKCSPPSAAWGVTPRAISDSWMEAEGTWPFCRVLLAPSCLPQASPPPQGLFSLITWIATDSFGFPPIHSFIPCLFIERCASDAFVGIGGTTISNTGCYPKPEAVGIYAPSQTWGIQRAPDAKMVAEG